MRSRLSSTSKDDMDAREFRAWHWSHQRCCREDLGTRGEHLETGAQPINYDKLQRRRGGFHPLGARLPRADKNWKAGTGLCVRTLRPLLCMVLTVLMRDMEKDVATQSFPKAGSGL